MFDLGFWLKRVNKRNLKSKSDYGIRVAKPGYDASYCSDSQLLFNSNWPILQITNVLDFRHAIEVSIYQRYNKKNQVDMATSERPDSLTISSSRDSNGHFATKRYIYKETSSTTYTDQSGNVWIETKYLRKTHRLNYPPMFIMSDHISDIPGYVVLLNVDLSSDVDYPYTEAPTMLYKAQHDYGIQSSSKFKPRVKGLSSNMFSKLVMSVKTLKTSVWVQKAADGSEYYNQVSWSPLAHKLTKKIEGCLLPYEFYAYNAKYKDDQGDPMYQEGSGNIITDQVGSTTNIGSPNAFMFVNDQLQSANTYEASTVVVVRSPMVSPEYEEVEII